MGFKVKFGNKYGKGRLEGSGEDEIQENTQEYFWRDDYGCTQFTPFHIGAPSVSIIDVKSANVYIVRWHSYEIIIDNTWDTILVPRWKLQHKNSADMS